MPPSGSTSEAEELYLSILQVDPNHPDANHNLGLMALQLAKRRSVHLSGNRVESRSSVGQYWLSLTECLLQWAFQRCAVADQRGDKTRLQVTASAAIADACKRRQQQGATFTCGSPGNFRIIQFGTLCRAGRANKTTC